MTSNFKLVFVSLFVISLFSCKTVDNKSVLVLYPPIDSLVTSDEVSVQAEGQNVWVENLNRPVQDGAPWWFYAPETERMELNIASFSCSGPVDLDLIFNKTVNSVIIKPVSKKIPFIKDGNKIKIKLSGPDNLYIEVDSMPPLLIFADPIETDIPTQVDENIRVFGPGTHNPGLITLEDNEQLYIAPGAIVYGAINGSPKGAKIFGRGILDGSKLERSGIRLNNASNVEFNGVTLRCGSGWQNTLYNCDSVTYRNVKILSFVPFGDGIDPVSCRNVTIDNCFFRCSDDCIAVKAFNLEEGKKWGSPGPCAANISVTNCTMIGYYCSDGFTIGFETNASSISNVQVKNCDILAAVGGNAIEGGHSAFSIICDGSAKIENVTFEDIRVEEIAALKLFELNVTDGQIYSKSDPGEIKGIHLKNIQWTNEAQIVLWGYDEKHMVKDVTFEGCSIAGKPFPGLAYSQLKMNSFVKDIEIIN